MNSGYCHIGASMVREGGQVVHDVSPCRVTCDAPTGHHASKLNQHYPTHTHARMCATHVVHRNELKWLKDLVAEADDNHGQERYDEGLAVILLRLLFVLLAIGVHQRRVIRTVRRIVNAGSLPCWVVHRRQQGLAGAAAAAGAARHDEPSPAVSTAARVGPVAKATLLRPLASVSGAVVRGRVEPRFGRPGSTHNNTCATTSSRVQGRYVCVTMHCCPPTYGARWRCHGRLRLLSGEEPSVSVADCLSGRAPVKSALNCHAAPNTTCAIELVSISLTMS